MVSESARSEPARLSAERSAGSCGRPRLPAERLPRAPGRLEAADGPPEGGAPALRRFTARNHPAAILPRRSPSAARQVSRIRVQDTAWPTAVIDPARPSPSACEARVHFAGVVGVTLPKSQAWCGSAFGAPCAVARVSVRRGVTVVAAVAFCEGGNRHAGRRRSVDLPVRCRRHLREHHRAEAVEPLVGARLATADGSLPIEAGAGRRERRREPRVSSWIRHPSLRERCTSFLPPQPPLHIM